MKSSPSSTLLLPLLLLDPLRTYARSCYYPNRNPDTASIPCRAAGGAYGEHSMCCGNNNEEVCLSNGLCLFLGDFTIDRNSCTDITWQDPACTRICANVTKDQHSDTQPCSNHQAYICCGNDTSCCDTKTGGWDLTMDNEQFGSAFYPEGDVLPSNSSSASPTAAAATATVTASSSPYYSSSSPSPSPSSSSSSPSLVALGAGIGVPLGSLFLITLALLIFQHRRRQRGYIHSQYSGNHLKDQAAPGISDLQYLDGQPPASELGLVSHAGSGGVAAGRPGAAAGYQSFHRQEIPSIGELPPFIGELPASSRTVDTPLAVRSPETGRSH